MVFKSSDPLYDNNVTTYYILIISLIEQPLWADTIFYGYEYEPDRRSAVKVLMIGVTRYHVTQAERWEIREGFIKELFLN